MDPVRQQWWQSRQGELSQLDSQLEKLELRARAIGYSEDSQHSRRMQALSEKRDRIWSLLDALSDVATDEFPRAADEIDRAINDLEESIREVVDAL